MTDYADLEIGLHRRDALRYSVELRFALPDNDAETRLDIDGPLLALIDQRALDRLDDDEEYGLALGQGLFGGGLGSAFRTAVATSQSKGVRLRVRLAIGPTAMSLHALRWETLRDPADGSTLLTNENVLFSRYLVSNDWRPVGLRPRGDLTALAVVAAPTGLDALDAGRPLAPIDVEAELALAREGLASLELTEMPGVARATADKLLDQLRHGYDVVYLVCHGYLFNEEPVLVLEDDEGRPAPMLGAELVERLRELTRTPRLVYVASCQSAGTGCGAEGAGVMAALGPRLAAAGVPVVVAMQGDVTMATARVFTRTFFDTLDEDGLVDRAAAVARSAVRERPDWWVPALFMRLRSGRLWYTPGLGGHGKFDKWASLVKYIARQQCTPIIGPGLSDPLLGSRQEIARSWARRYRYPMAPHNRESLPQVAQYLATSQSTGFPYLELEDHLRRTLIEHYGEELAGRPDLADAPLDDLVAIAWQARHARDIDPYSVLAALPSAVYVTTQPSRLLADALTDAGRRPEIELCRWNDEVYWSESVFDREPAYRPTVERPLLFHLLGAFSQPDSLVLTEDDYFDFLIGVTRNQELVPKIVRRMLADSALMFVGFRIDEWDFRVLYRSLIQSEGRGRRKGYTNVAVQVDPEEGAATDAGRARNYLEEYFGGSNIDLYWGSTDNFVKELHDQWSNR